MLSGKTVVLGITGGIAAYKAAEVLRLLTKAGATVHVVMTHSATEFITPLTFQTLSANPVHTDQFALISQREIGHISLADRADLLIIAPATANCIGKIANGIADDLLTTTIMATRAPVLIAPAMNVNMYTNPRYQANESLLRSQGYLFVNPERGSLACGWQGEGRLAAPVTIVEAAITALTPQDLAGHRILVTAGPTREELDPVRYLSNHSSGKMGYALAKAARQRGAQVMLVSGPVALSPPSDVEVIPITSAQEMREAVISRADQCTVIIKAAAVADYRPEQRCPIKIKKGSGEMNLTLVKNPDILAELGAQEHKPFLVGFAAETGEEQTWSTDKLRAKGCDLLVANDVSQPDAGFNVDTNRVILHFKDGRQQECPLMSKETLAHTILDKVSLEIS